MIPTLHGRLGKLRRIRGHWTLRAPRGSSTQWRPRHSGPRRLQESAAVYFSLTARENPGNDQPAESLRFHPLRHGILAMWCNRRDLCAPFSAVERSFWRVPPDFSPRFSWKRCFGSSPMCGRSFSSSLHAVGVAQRRGCGTK